MASSEFKRNSSLLSLFKFWSAIIPNSIPCKLATDPKITQLPTFINQSLEFGLSRVLPTQISLLAEPYPTAAFPKLLVSPGELTCMCPSSSFLTSPSHQEEPCPQGSNTENVSRASQVASSIGNAVHPTRASCLYLRLTLVQ